GEPVFFALTSTPSIGPSSAEVTWPASASGSSVLSECSPVCESTDPDNATAPQTSGTTSRNLDRIGTSRRCPFYCALRLADCGMQRRTCAARTLQRGSYAPAPSRRTSTAPLVMPGIFAAQSSAACSV